jgi:hypothetical protein
METLLKLKSKIKNCPQGRKKGRGIIEETLERNVFNKG